MLFVSNTDPVLRTLFLLFKMSNNKTTKIYSKTKEEIIRWALQLEAFYFERIKIKSWYKIFVEARNRLEVDNFSYCLFLQFHFEASTYRAEFWIRKSAFWIIWDLYSWSGNYYSKMDPYLMANLTDCWCAARWSHFHLLSVVKRMRTASMDFRQSRVKTEKLIDNITMISIIIISNRIEQFKYF